MTCEVVGRCYGPDELKLLGEAFDQAWAAIVHRVGENTLLIEAVRLRLANAVLNQETRCGRDVESLRDAALEEAGFRYFVRQRLPGVAINRVSAPWSAAS